MRRNGARDEETLDAVGADGAHGVELGGFFHPFDRHLDAHAMAQLDDRVYERAVERFPVDVLDEQASIFTMSAGDWASRPSDE